MKIYLNGFDVIGDLHRNGFDHDFQLFGHNLYWVQRKVFIRSHEFHIVEYHRIQDVQNDRDEFIAFGITAPHLQLKGILINHFKNYSNQLPTVLRQKLNELHMSTLKFKEDK